MNLSLTVKLLQIFATLRCTGRSQRAFILMNMTVGTQNILGRAGGGLVQIFSRIRQLLAVQQRCNPENGTTSRMNIRTMRPMPMSRSAKLKGGEV